MRTVLYSHDWEPLAIVTLTDSAQDRLAPCDLFFIHWYEMEPLPCKPNPDQAPFVSLPEPMRLRVEPMHFEGKVAIALRADGPKISEILRRAFDPCMGVDQRRYRFSVTAALRDYGILVE